MKNLIKSPRDGCCLSGSKFLKIMKLSVLLMMLTVAQIFAAESYSQNMRISLNLNEVTVADVLEEIESISEFSFFYNNKLIDVNREVSINVNNKDIYSILEELFDKTDVQYVVEGRHIILSNQLKSDIYNQPAEGEVITGTVKDIFDNPLAGVTVVVKGTTNGTITDLNGDYVLKNVPRDTVLVFSFLGMETQEVALAGRTVINITLKESSVELDEVVLVGYGTARKSDVTGAISSVKEDVLKEIPSGNLTQALQGRAAGITISQESTRPGSTQQIRIRGTRSLTASNDPLIVLDGIPFSGNLNDISPEDIASIDILKDASSTAIYGSRGANGVILITTHRGEEGKMQFTYNGYYGVKKVAKRYDLMDGEEFIALREKSGYNNYTPNELENMESGTYTDWQDLMYQDGMVTNHDFLMTAGKEKSRFSFGTSYYDETSVLPGQEFSRILVRGTFDQSVGHFLDFGMTTHNSYNTTSGSGEDAPVGIMYAIATLSPLASAYDDEGNIVLNPQGPAETQYNPLLYYDEDVWSELGKRFVSFNTLYGELKLFKGMRYRVNIGLNFVQSNYGSFYSSNSPQINGGLSVAKKRNYQSESYTLDNLLYYDRIFAMKHRISLTAMLGIEGSTFQQSEIDASGMIADYVQFYNLGLSDGIVASAANQDYYKRTLESYMFRVNYSFHNRYVFTGTFRRDGSSVLSEGNKWHSFPSLSVAWNISEESFMEKQELISVLRLRMGYGLTANQAVSPYSTLGRLSQNLYNFGSDYAYGYYVSGMPTTDVGWENTSSYNLGIDFGMFDNRLTGSFDAYYQKTNDLLLNVSLPSTSGIAEPVLMNLGSTENKGFEVILSGEIIQSENKGGFNFGVDANFYLNRNKLLELYSGVEEDVGNGWFVGHPIDVIYDYEKLGIWQLNEEEEAESYNQRVGDIKVKDFNNDGVIDSEDRRIIGTYEPDFEGGFTFRFEYKHFDLSTVAFYRVGGTLVSTILQPQSYLTMMTGRRNQLDIDYWTPDNPTNFAPEPRTDGSSEYTSTMGYYDASFLKFRTITLGYTLPNNWLKEKHLAISSCRVYFLCQNPFVLFSPYMDAGGIDPEATGRGEQGVTTDTGSSQQRQLTIGVNTPPTRNFIFGINLKF